MGKVKEQFLQTIEDIMEGKPVVFPLQNLQIVMTELYCLFGPQDYHLTMVDEQVRIQLLEVTRTLVE